MNPESPLCTNGRHCCELEYQNVKAILNTVNCWRQNKSRLYNSEAPQSYVGAHIQRGLQCGGFTHLALHFWEGIVGCLNYLEQLVALHDTDLALCLYLQVEQLGALLDIDLAPDRLAGRCSSEADPRSAGARKLPPKPCQTSALIR